MRLLNKRVLVVLLTGAVALSGVGVAPVGANEFKTKDPTYSESIQYNYMNYDWHVISLKSGLIADSLKNTVIPTLYKELQAMEDKNPDLMFILYALPPNGWPTDRIGDQPNAAGGSATPTTAITWITDILNIDTCGEVRGVTLKEEYKTKAKELFGDTETDKLEVALSKLFTNASDVYIVVYKGPGLDSLNVQSIQEPDSVPECVNSLDAKYSYMLVALIAVANGCSPEQIGQYKREYNQKYNEILIALYKYECAVKACADAEWLKNNANNNNVPEEIKIERYIELKMLLEQLGIYI